jgi:hypothetical protein
MKTKLNMKSRFNRTFAAMTILLMLTTLSTSAQVISQDQTIIREFNVKPGTVISFENKVGTLAVEKWDQEKVKLDIIAYVKGDDAGDIETVLKAIGQPQVQESSTQLNINTKFYDSFISKDVIGSQRITITLTDGTKVKLRELSVSYVLTIPSTNEFRLTQKYEDVTIADLDGRVVIEIYSCDLKAGMLPNAYGISLKYATASIRSVGDTKLEVYDSKLDLIDAGNLELSSKYSESNIEKTGNLNLDIYDDKVYIKEHGNVNGAGKYTTLTLNNFTTGDLELYDCTFRAGKTDELSLVAKYSKIDLVSVRKLRFNECYDNQVNIEYVGDMRVTSKYTTFNIDELASNMYLDSYDDKVMIYRVNKDFSDIELDGKYTNLTLIMQEGAKYELNADMQYTEFDYPKNKIREVRYHKEHSSFQFKGVSVDASEGEALPEIRIGNYSGEVVIKN